MQAPTECVLLTAVHLPLPTHRQRLAALPFAVEDLVSQPLSELHVALGEEVAPRSYLAAVVSRRQMEIWVDLLANAGFEDWPLVPDALLLPRPQEGMWAVRRSGDRVVVRTPTSGFATPAGWLATAWTAQGRPALLSYGEAAPGDLPFEVEAPSTLPPPGFPALDLRQGAYEVRRPAGGQAARRIAAVLAAGVVAHALVLAADTAALRRIAGQHREEALALVRQADPSAANDADLVAALDRLSSTQGAGPGDFLPLLSRTSAALQPFAADVTIRSLGYDSGSLSLSVEAPDIARLQQVRAALTRAGLSASEGAAVAGAGQATGEIVIRGRPA